MKKLLLSLGVIGTFALYSLTQQNEGSDVGAVPVPMPTSGPVPAAGNAGTQTTAPSTGQGQSGMGMNGQGPGTGGQMMGRYKNGEYVGSVADAYYGYIQVKAVVTNGQISDVQFLQYPNDRATSIMINSQAMPILKSEAISAQTANVDIVSGATDSSQAFIQSLGAALASAK